MLQHSLPVWPIDRNTEMNLSVKFRALIHSEKGQQGLLRLTASTIYRCYMNGTFIGNGPAVSAHDVYRVDELDVSSLLITGVNIVAIEVAGYNVNSYYLLDQPSFLQAELLLDGQLAAATGISGVASIFEAAIMTERVQRFPRYSFQRPFAEAYRLTPLYDEWHINPESDWKSVACEVQPNKQLIPRSLAYAAYPMKSPESIAARGKARLSPPSEYWKDRSMVNIGPQMKGYREDQLEWNPSLTLQQWQMVAIEGNVDGAVHEISLEAVEDSAAFQIVDFGRIVSGFICFEAVCTEPSTLYITFDEILTEDKDVEFKRLECYNIITVHLEQAGTYSFQSMESYTHRYAKLNVLHGELIVRGLQVREYVNKQTDRASFDCDDERINRVFEAGRETFKQSAVDNFTDCPSRERAGWLCDSFFMARVALDLCGNTTIEDAFFENYTSPEHFACLPEGMLPMCYPADHYDGIYIPNWSLWFVVQLEEYAYRSGKHERVEKLRLRVEQLFQFFDRYRNKDGLLERLDSWIFVEWSKANEFVQDVNYPTNMLYAAALSAAARLYGRQDWQNEAENIRAVILEQAFTGDFFADHAVRDDLGHLLVLDDFTEVCQYYAFYFNIASSESHPQLWETMRTAFGPGRNRELTYIHVHPANAFPGNYLRLELLHRYGYSGQIVAESVSYFNYMAERTGTLWEHDLPTASCCHGFASHIVHVYYRDILGFHSVDTIQKTITIRITDNGLTRCTGTIPVSISEEVTLSWVKIGNVVQCTLDLPEGYRFIDESLLSTNWNQNEHINM